MNVPILRRDTDVFAFSPNAYGTWSQSFSAWGFGCSLGAVPFHRSFKVSVRLGFCLSCVCFVIEGLVSDSVSCSCIKIHQPTDCPFRFENRSSWLVLSRYSFWQQQFSTDLYHVFCFRRYHILIDHHDIENKRLIFNATSRGDRSIEKSPQRRSRNHAGTLLGGRAE